MKVKTSSSLRPVHHSDLTAQSPTPECSFYTSSERGVGPTLNMRHASRAGHKAVSDHEESAPSSSVSVVQWRLSPTVSHVFPALVAVSLLSTVILPTVQANALPGHAFKTTKY